MKRQNQSDDLTMSKRTARRRVQDSQPVVPGSTQSAGTPCPLNIAIHGVSLLTNSRLSSEELDMCIELLEEGVHPQALVDVLRNLRSGKNETVSFRL